MKKTHLLLLSGICIAGLIVRIALIRVSISPWWDPAIYIGMGKFLFTNGASGLWETLRPPLWPVVLGFVWKLGLNPLLTAKWIVALSSIATIILVYILGEKTERGIGLMAALVLAVSPAFTFFTAIPTNDIPSACIALFAAYMLLTKRYFWSGVVVGIAFIMRFPHGLFLVPFGFFILIEVWNSYPHKEWIIVSLKKILQLALGFALIAVPYFIINYFVFNDPLLPIKEGQEIISGSSPEKITFYLKFLLIDNPLIIFAGIGILVYIFACIRNKKVPSNALTLSVLCIGILGTYFSYVGHKELRYSFAFLPFLVIMAGYCLNLHSIRKRPGARFIKYYTLGIIVLIGTVNLTIQIKDQYVIALAPQRQAYYSFIPNGVSAITSSPQVMLESNAKIVGVFDTWENGISQLDAFKNNIDYVALDSCQITCISNQCDAVKDTFMQKLNASSTIVYAATDGGVSSQCTLSIYKLR